MPVTAIIGGQWGDEGKGKIVDLLCEKAEIVARYQGGANAGHTVKVDGETYILHQVPSGILHKNRLCVLGHGMVIDPVALCEEIDMLEGLGIDHKGRIQISYSAHIVSPIHKLMDLATGQMVGTTGRGIGPAYSDKAMRISLRGFDLLNSEKLGRYLGERMRLLNDQFKIDKEALAKLAEDVDIFLKAAERMVTMLSDTVATLLDAIRADRNVMVEGAQGVLLDLDLGTYPFVTSSHPTVGGVCTGLGIPANSITRVVGIFKAYLTRVGEGPFPTELMNEDGAKLQDVGQEFGATTGRKRRCGWFDAVAARYSCRVNGFNDMVITKLDVLDEFETIKVCTAYEVDGRRIESFSSVIHKLGDVKPIFREFPGWKTTTSNLTSADQLPSEAIAYIKALEDFTETRVSTVSVGPERNQILSL